MRLTKSIYIFCLFLIVGCSTIKTDNQHGNSLKLISKNLYEANSNQVLVAAHPGDWRNAPENSIEGIKSAIAMGVDIVEIDLQRTKDGHLILMHDKAINRTTNGKGEVKNYTLEELKAFNLLDSKGKETRYKICTLEEAMLAAKGKVLVNLDKSYVFFREAYAILKKTGTTGQVIMKGTAAAEEVLRANSDLLKSVPYMPVISLDKPITQRTILSYQEQLKPVAFEFIFSKDTSAIINQFPAIRSGGSRVWVNTLWPSLNGGHHDDLAVVEGNLKDSWDWIIAKGVNIIQTDRPQELLTYLQKRKLHQ